eukprot:TRINITY_DN451_c0_g1_i1.p1 TRINITY_DN451_c0_g1~~TRINITY_DN451_c0_g1_i1.p1  ORF type:complete len:311 (-),score=67.69 TRINITY_DN451_c0_g1_i1:79-1011(-)
MLVWSPVQPKGPGLSVGGVRSHSATLIDDKIYIYGGCDIGDKFNHMLILDTKSMHWERPLPTEGFEPSVRRAHSATAVGKKLFVFGGGDGPNYFKDLYIFDTRDHTWTKPVTTGTSPGPRRAHTAELIGNKLYVFGGGDGAKALNDTYVLDTDKFVWTLLKTTGPAPARRGYHRSALAGTRIFIFGGSDGNECFSDLYMLETRTGVWAKLPVQNSGPLLAHSSVMVGGSSVLVYGGHNASDYESSVRFLNLRTAEWTYPRCFGKGPSARGYQATVYHDHRLWVIGGFDGTSCFPDVHILEMGAYVCYEKS